MTSGSHSVRGQWPLQIPDSQHSCRITLRLLSTARVALKVNSSFTIVTELQLSECLLPYRSGTFFFQSIKKILKFNNISTRTFSKFGSSHHRGLFIGKYLPPRGGGGDISRCHLGEKIWKGKEKMRGKCKRKRKKGKRKRKKGERKWEKRK